VEVAPSSKVERQLVSRCGSEGKNIAARNRRRFAKQHWNNATGRVFAETVIPDDADVGPVTRNKRKRPEDHPGPLSYRQMQKF
jgi:hypothetical protein